MYFTRFYTALQLYRYSALTLYNLSLHPPSGSATIATAEPNTYT